MLTTRILFVCLPLFSLASCWSDLGHRTIAYLAYNLLETEVRNWIKDNKLIDTDISDDAVYPDRHDKIKFGCWHAINTNDNPFKGGCSVNVSEDCFCHACKKEHEKDYETECPHECIVTAIPDQVAKMQNKSANDAEHRFAFRYILHLMGDLHQPLHAEGYQIGGHNICVTFDKVAGSGEKPCYTHPNLHQVWDDLIIRKYRNLKADDDKSIKTEAQNWAKALQNITKEEHCPGGVKDRKNVLKCVEEWTKESNQVNCDVVYTKNCDIKCLEKDDLAGKYYDSVRDTAVEQIKKAAGRLAGLINDIAAAAIHSTSTLNVQEL